MKKNGLILGLLCMATTLFAQQPQPANGGFENWITPPHRAANWTSNVNVILANFELMERTEDSHSGNYAAKMEAKAHSVMGIGSINVPGGCTNGKVEIDFEALSIVFTGGQSFAARPTAFTGWYKYTSAEDDNMTITCLLKKAGDTLAFAEFTNSNTVSAYTQFSIAFDYESYPYDENENPDTMLIIMTSSDIMNAKIGSTLIIDDLAFTYPASIKTYEYHTAIYPNPAKDFVYISSTEAAISQITVFDIAGRKIMQKNTQSQNSVEIPVSEWVAGIYFAQIETDKGVVTRKVNVVK